MKQVSRLSLVVMLASPVCGWAADYPITFSDFFAKQDDAVVVRLAGDTVGLRLDALISYDDFQLTQKGVAPLRRYLSDKGLRDGAVDAITRRLTDGVPANPGCKVNLAVCAPVVRDKDIQFVFDYDNHSLAIFVGSAWLARTAEQVTYHPARQASNALVNQARVYGYTDEAMVGGISVSNLTTVGLPYGHLLLNTQYQSADNALDVYKGVYDLEVGGTRAVLGYSERDRVFFNTTDFLNDDADYTSYAAQVGSSRNLVRGGSERLQSVYFFAPQAGQLEVYQGSRLLLTRTVSQGRQAIAYSELPAGAYDVRLRLRAAGQVVLDESRQIVNSQQFSLPVGNWDYVLAVGQFEGVPALDELQWLSEPAAFATQYAQLRSSWRLSDNLLLAGSLTSNQDDQYAQAGMSYAWQDWLLATYQAGLFSSDDWYQSGTLTLGPVFLSARRFDSDETNRAYRLSSQLYDEQSFFNYSATYSTVLWGGSGYVSYTHYESDAPYTIDETRSSNMDDVSAGWMTSWRGWQLGLSTAYSKNESYDDLKFGVTASYALGEGLTSQLSLTTDQHGLSRGEAGLTKSISRGAWSASGTASTAWQRNQGTPEEAALSGSINGRTDWFNASAYGYVSTADRRMLSGTLTGTQFISGEGAGMTPEVGTSFMHIVPEVVSTPGGDAPSLDGVNYNVRRGTNNTYQGRLTGEEAAIPLTPYTDTEFVMDAESLNLHIDNNIRREFVYPGTVYTVDARITPMVTQLFVLNDLQGQPIHQVRCVGDACAGVEPVSDDGVFRVNYRAGGTFTLLSKNQVCINEPALLKDGAINTYCLPGLMGDEERVAYTADGSMPASDLLYVGKFESHRQAQTMMGRLGEVGLTAESVKVGQHLYLYVQHHQPFDLAQRTLLDGLDAYVVQNDVNIDKLFSAR